MKCNLCIKNFRSLTVMSVVVSLLLLFSATSYGQSKDINSKDSILELLSKLEETTPKGRKEAVLKIYTLGKQAIPDLVDNITNTRGLPFLLKNPRNSTLSSSQLRNSAGLTSAYLIELIIGRENFSISGKSEYFIFGNSANYIYWQGTIEDLNGEEIKDYQLNEVKLQYEDWWSNNKEKPIESIRKEWSEGKTPLSKSNFKWQ